MVKNYLTRTLLGTLLMLLCCSVLLASANDGLTSNDPSLHVRSLLLNDLGNNTLEEDGCYVELPQLSLDGTCVSASGAPDSFGDAVEYMWLEYRNGEFIPQTDWATDAPLNFCPDTPGYYRMCARTVGCSEIYESPDVYVPNVDCGSLDGIYIYDQDTDQRAFGPITNGQDIDIDLLPSNYYIVAETQGHIGSVQLTVNSHQIVENVVLFTFPGGAENGNNWNAGIGHHAVYAAAFRNDNAVGHECDDIYLEFNIVPSCDITVDAGNDISVCDQDSVTLAASVANTQDCEGGCVYPIIESDRCGGGNPSEIWMSNPGQNFFNTTLSSSFEVLPNGNAVYNSRVSNGSDTLDVHLLFSGRTTTPPAGSPKLGCDTNDTSDYVYWTTTTGTIVSEHHGTFQVSRMGEAFQMGIGGDVTRTGFGASGWFHVTGGDGFYTNGDVNIKLDECVSSDANNAPSYVWTTTNGHIVGSANQQGITVDQSGTYQVRVQDCQDCEAIDQVTVSFTDGIHVDAGEDVEICNETSTELTASITNAEDCIGGCEYPIITEAKCYGGDSFEEIWVANPQQNGFATTLRSNFKILADGTAIYTGLVSNGFDTLDVNLVFTGRTTTAPQDSPKLGCDTDDTSDYIYWTHTAGTVVSENHGTFTVSRMGEAFQLGIGGDVTRTGFGASGWFSLTGGDGYYQRGDVNIKLGECNPITTAANVAYEWTTNDGHIVGDAQQQTITVDASGTYQIKVKDCKNCEAIDEVQVTISKPEAGTITADVNPVCLEDNGALIAATVDGNQHVPNGYSQAYVLTSGDNLLIQDFNTVPEFTVNEAGKYTVHTFVYPTDFDPSSVVTVGQTTGFDVNALLVQGGGELCASLDVNGAMVHVESKVNIGDFVWVDENQNGIQDDGATGINGVIATLFSENGTEIATTVTTNNPITNAPGWYNFEACQNSGSYYVVFSNLPSGFEITTQNNGDDLIDSDINQNGRTNNFDVFQEDVLSIDAGIFT
ncbi:SdrD B-like domain-containing protein, partial [Croceitalea dokdonensis]|uniref:SdrD B-like domain-containing protein n=1 Tax=Croceitalea dokdonensis TaxID=346188 RepID=UPI000B2076A1